ncbi:MAG: cytochrome d ubiquinol oxidase subunit II [Deltaproteobacteria bacterium]|nr:cytochrome d ubiquinol oxidase subunit II [Deltaproteobacteria bacterium]
MTLADLAAGAMLAALAVYATTGGADFGGGIWDLLATGPRRADQRRAIEAAIAPVWEANHVWLIFVIVVLFTAFPPAFARLGTQFHIPLTLMLIGIVLRGSAFVFRHDGPREGSRWGAVFAVSSVTAPFFLGCVLGAMTTGHAWTHPFPVAVGVLVLATFAFLAAVYLTVETTADLRADFARRAELAAIVVAVAGAVVAGLAYRLDTPFGRALLTSAWSIPLVVTAIVSLAVTLFALRRAAYRIARLAAIAVVVLFVVGWGAAQYPVLIAPDLTLANAASPHRTLALLIPIVVGGAAVLVPSLWYLLRVFKNR